MEPWKAPNGNFNPPRASALHFVSPHTFRRKGWDSSWILGDRASHGSALFSVSFPRRGRFQSNQKHNWPITLEGMSTGDILPSLKALHHTDCFRARCIPSCRVQVDFIKDWRAMAVHRQRRLQSAPSIRVSEPSVYIENYIILKGALINDGSSRSELGTVFRQ